MCRLYNVIASIYTLWLTFQNIDSLFHKALSHIKIRTRDRKWLTASIMVFTSFFG